jgi:hypothetical protein
MGLGRTGLGPAARRGASSGLPAARGLLAVRDRRAGAFAAPTCRRLAAGVAGGQPSSPASVFITLAGTSVGRGWDCVGHRAGTYRNRVRLEAVGPDSHRQSGGGGSAATGSQGSRDAQAYLIFSE